MNDALDIYEFIRERRKGVILKADELRSLRNLERLQHVRWELLDSETYLAAFVRAPWSETKQLVDDWVEARHLAPLCFVEGPERFGASRKLLEFHLGLDSAPFEYDEERYQ